jgi:hypothetical protein
MISTTLFLVFFTTICFGALMPFVFKFLNKNENIIQNNSKNNVEDDFEKYSIQRYDSNSSIDYLASEKNLDGVKYKIKGLWHSFDNKIMKPFFIADWPFVKEDHNEISRKIIAVFEEHQRKKVKNKELQNLTKNSKTSADKIVSLLTETELGKPSL